ncbi:hypothetical protein [Streptomyces mayonensis]|uniref:hypothetical protein n=1 Tax=Streptomyces mayonensis TaxID=2750816 RepID=UPI001C1DE0DD|nr:hypothetical protein [Streptomyces sp. A108]MBU6529585.1 hypothetical protein [Streptomyces sp. A108]
MDVSGELATVGTAAASALVVAMAGDGWRGFRTWLGRWFGDESDRQLTRLDRDREALLSAPEGEREDQAAGLSAAWAVRLQDEVDEAPEAGRELLAYVKQWQAENAHAAPQVGALSQRAKAKGKSRITQVGRDQITVRPERRS